MKRGPVYVNVNVNVNGFYEISLTLIEKGNDQLLDPLTEAAWDMIFTSPVLWLCLFLAGCCVLPLQGELPRNHGGGGAGVSPGSEMTRSLSLPSLHDLRFGSHHTQEESIDAISSAIELDPARHASHNGAYADPNDMCLSIHEGEKRAHVVACSNCSSPATMCVEISRSQGQKFHLPFFPFAKSESCPELSPLVTHMGRGLAHSDGSWASRMCGACCGRDPSNHKWVKLAGRCAKCTNIAYFAVVKRTGRRSVEEHRSGSSGAR